MKKNSEKERGVTKGMPSAVLLSILIHAALFLLAGMLVVFTVVKKEEKKFEPPKAVERPKMKLKKPKVKLKKTSKPKSTTRIVTKVNRSSMPDIQLPELSGMGGGGLGEGLGGGFDMLPGLEDVTVFGAGQSIGNDLVANFYDFKRDRTGRGIASSDVSNTDALKRFISSGWKTSEFSRYYKSPKPLYSTCVLLPSIPSFMGPKCFNEKTMGYHWAVHYTGELVYPEDITFRFWGYGDNILVVAVDGETVLNACRGDNKYIAEWNSNTAKEGSFLLSGSDRYAFGGRWIELKAGVPRKLDIVIGEVYGGGFSAMLVVQVEGVDYPSRPGSSCPMYPMFKTAEPTRDLLDSIMEIMPEHEVALTNGPVFKDYLSGPAEETPVEPDSAEVETAAVGSEPEESRRVWTTGSGKQFEGEFIVSIGDKLVFQTKRGKQVKVPKGDISDEDLEYITLNNPPEFAIEFVKKSQTILNRYPLGPTSLGWGVAPPEVFDYTFGARVKQTMTTLDYEYELTLEYFAIGKEKYENAFILLDRQSSSFIPSRENRNSHSFDGDIVEVVEFGRFGKKYVGYLVTITDSRGKIIQHRATSPWLWENMDNLKQMPVGRYMDKTCTRTFPTPVKRTY